MKYAVITSSDNGKKAVFLESNFFKENAVFSCVKVEIKEILKHLESLSEAELTEALWKLENYDSKKIPYNRIPVGANV